MKKREIDKGGSKEVKMKKKKEEKKEDIKIDEKKK